MTPSEVTYAPVGTTLWDDQVTGLHLRVGPSGRRFFLFYRTKTGRQRRPKVGDFPSCTLQEARRRAQILLSKVALGEDPKGAWEAAKAEITVEELFQKVWSRHWDTPRFQLSGWAYEVSQAYTTRIRAGIGGYRLSEVTPGFIREWHGRFAATPVAANRSLEVLSKMFSYAIDHELFMGSNPCAKVAAFVEKERSRYATEEEVARIGEVLRAEVAAYPLEVAFIYLLIFTGARPRSLERAKRSQLNDGILRFQGKSSAATGKEETVVFPANAIRIVECLPRRKDDLLIGIKFPRRFWERVQIKAQCKGLWARDWRRTFATIGNSSGVEMGLIGELLNHRSPQTTKIYAKLLPRAGMAAARLIADRAETLLSASCALTLPLSDQPAEPILNSASQPPQEPTACLQSPESSS